MTSFSIAKMNLLEREIYMKNCALKTRVMVLLKSHRIYPIMKDLNISTYLVH